MLLPARSPVFYTASRSDRTVRIWHLDSGASDGVLGHSHPVACMALHDEAGILCTGSGPVLSVWRLSDRRLTHALSGHEGAIICVRIVSLLLPCRQDAHAADAAPAHHDGTAPLVCAFSGAVDGVVRAWDVRFGRPLFVMRGHVGPITCLAVPSDADVAAQPGPHSLVQGMPLVLSGSADGTVRVWVATSGVCLFSLGGRAQSTVDAPPANHFVSALCFTQRTVAFGFVPVGGAYTSRPPRAAAGQPDRAHALEHEAMILWDFSSGRSAAPAGAQGPAV